MVLDFESGRSPAEFFKRTMPLRAASRASIWFLGSRLGQDQCSQIAGQ